MDLELRSWTWPALPKGEWGPRGWNWLHVVAISYPLHPTSTDARIAFRRIWSFVSHLPCAVCRIHATRFVLRNPPNLASTDALQVWAWGFHNAVNLRLGKPSIPYAEYQRLYACEILWARANRTLHPLA